MRLEEQRPPDNLLWPFLLRIINGGLTLDNWRGKITTGTTPFIVPNFYQGGWVIQQYDNGNVRFEAVEEGMQVTSAPPGVTVKVFVV